METARRALQDYRLQRAIRWVSERVQEQPAPNRGELVNEASARFGLSPRQEEFLYGMYRKEAGG